MSKADEILHKGWAITLSASGYCEGPKWWEARATAMGSICPRVVKTDRYATIEEVAEALQEAIDDVGGECDFNWTKDRIQKKLQDLDEEISQFEHALSRVDENLDLLGKPRCDKDGTRMICSTCEYESSWTEHCKKGAAYCKSWKKRVPPPKVCINCTKLYNGEQDWSGVGTAWGPLMCPECFEAAGKLKELREKQEAKRDGEDS